MSRSDLWITIQNMASPALIARLGLREQQSPHIWLCRLVDAIERPDHWPGEPQPAPPARTCKHCKRNAKELGPVGMWQHCPEHEGGSLLHEYEPAAPVPPSAPESEEEK